MIDYIKTKQFNKSCKSMDDPFTGCDGETTNLTDLLNPRIVESSTIGSWSMGTLDSEIKKLDCRRALQEAIDSLPDVQRTMINELFVKPQPMGKNGELKRTQAEVRRTMGITKGEGDKQYALPRRSRLLRRPDLLTVGDGPRADYCRHWRAAMVMGVRLSNEIWSES